MAVADVEDPAPLIKVVQVLKPNGEIHVNDVIPICQGMGFMELPIGEHPTTLVFIEGKDGSTWVPTWGYFGVVPRGEGGRFTPDWVSEGPMSVSVDELQKLIK